MPSWNDSFNRVDGPIGPNWSIFSGAASISGNRLTATVATVAVAGAITGPGAASAQVTIPLTGGTFGQLGPMVKRVADGSQYLFGDAVVGSGQITYTIRGSTGTTGNVLATYVWTGTVPATVTLRISWTSPTVYLYANGVLVCQYSNAAYNSGTLLGVRFGAPGGWMDDFSCSGDGSKVLTVTPRVVGTADGDVLLSLLATSVNWTPGIPGSPTFTVNDGALSLQQVTSLQTASVLFSPPLTPGTVTLLDGADGISATITVVSGSYIGGGLGGVGGLTEAAVGWLEAQAAHGGLVLADIDTLTGAPAPDQIKKSLGDVLTWLDTYVNPYGPIHPGEEWGGWMAKILNNNAIPDGTHNLFDLATTTDYYTQLIYPLVNDLTSSGAISLSTVVSSLEGVGLIDNTQLKNAIDAISAGDNTAVLAAIAGAKGDPLATIKTVIDQLFVLSHLGAYDLGDVKDWAESVRGSGLPTIKGVLDKLGGSGNTIEARIDALSDLIVTENTIQGMLNMAIAALTGGEGFTLAAVQETVIDAINGLSFPTVSSSVRWPGLSGVTLGDPLELSDGLTIEGPMHGLLFEIIRSQPGGGNYEFGTVRSWSHVGGVIFCTDSGHYERSQSIGPEHQIVTPFTMEAAESAILRLNGGFTGTVRTWIRT